MSLLEICLIIAAFGAGLLVGRKNPSIASAASAIVAAGESKAAVYIAAAKAKLGIK